MAKANNEPTEVENLTSATSTTTTKNWQYYAKQIFKGAIVGGAALFGLQQFFSITLKKDEIDDNISSSTKKSAIEEKFKETIRRHLILTGKKRFLSKQTANNQRIRLINEMFKDAYFILMIRDGRAVSNSLLNVKWWNNFDIWWLGKKAPEWEIEGREPIELCGLNWKRNVEEILENKALFEDRYIEIRYEEFVKDVKGSMQRVTKYCELSESKKFLKMLPQTLSNMNYKWEENLTEKQKIMLEKTLRGFLNQLRYN